MKEIFGRLIDHVRYSAACRQVNQNTPKKLANTCKHKTHLKMRICIKAKYYLSAFSWPFVCSAGNNFSYLKGYTYILSSLYSASASENWSDIN